MQAPRLLPTFASDMSATSRHLVAPSLLAADLGDMDGVVAICQAGGADWIHVDVMDGHFVPNISMGIPVLAALRRRTHMYLDVHLMITSPERYLAAFVQAGASQLTIHAEACADLHSILAQIKALGVQAGVAINPATPVSVLDHVWPMMDTLCLMSVSPGFGGQTFIPGSLGKIAQARGVITRLGLPCRIQIDGGVDLANAPTILAAGADVLVAGSSIFSHAEPAGAIQTLKRL